jgi:hypothetical protein
MLLPFDMIGRSCCTRKNGARTLTAKSLSKSSIVVSSMDGFSTGMEVPSMWVLLRPPRFGGAKHARSHDNRSRHRKVGFSAS